MVIDLILKTVLDYMIFNCFNILVKALALKGDMEQWKAFWAAGRCQPLQWTFLFPEVLLK